MQTNKSLDLIKPAAARACSQSQPLPAAQLHSVQGPAGGAPLPRALDQLNWKVEVERSFPLLLNTLQNAKVPGVLFSEVRGEKLEKEGEGKRGKHSQAFLWRMGQG